ncbi:unnamed protein product [Cochlearia groenlandica]
MGNYVSSVISKTSSFSSTSVAKVILPDGEVRRIHAPTKAGEVMIEIPRFFLVDSKSLKIGKKINPLAADDDLRIKGRHVYITFPMTRATSAANASDLTRLYVAVKKQQQRRRIGDKSSSGVGSVFNGKVSPAGEGDDVMVMMKLNLEDIEEFSAAEFMHRISVSKSKKPKLETILEESLS